MSEQDPQQQYVDYRLAPLVTVRFIGFYLCLLAVVVFIVTPLVILADWSLDVIVIVAILGLIGLAVTGWWLRSRAYIMRAAPDGYSVRMVRGAGVKAARWTQVEDAITTTIHDEPCVVLRLKDGGTTTIPVSVLAVDREQFVRELQQHLQHGHRLK
ncbi:hypothetical protein [Nocardioides sp. CER19]|uniref:hypothetical protein n=1 Tax=Nocardioides sp. CER19 TaxID=3038538 RepID=UPI00244B0152|nr:hypothetical protein [Nocardioides sp. CER19]MDH2412972.1 hypothetical protein [Nocardioides sp. CER19]